MTPAGGYGRRQRAIDACGIGAFAVLSVAAAARLLSNVDPAAALAGAFLGFLAADLVSGIVHWIGDKGDAEWPILGPSLIRPFREHHEDPRAIAGHDFVETNGASSLGATLVSLAGLVIPVDGASGCVAGWALLSLAFWLFATNQIHKWAHSASAPRVIRGLQRRRWILSPEHHALHHAAPFDRCYCITTGWMNPVLARIRFFAALERCLSAASDAVARRPS